MLNENIHKTKESKAQDTSFAKCLASLTGLALELISTQLNPIFSFSKSFFIRVKSIIKKVTVLKEQILLLHKSTSKTVQLNPTHRKS